MILSLCMIVKGDEELAKLKRAVASVAEYVDGVYITTNASEYAQTKKWCEDMGYEHSHLDWDNDFSRQRNFNFAQARSDTDYIVWMDSDDVIVNPHLLRKYATGGKRNGYDTVFFAYWYGAKFDGEPSLDTFIEQEITHYRERLIRPGSIVWKKRIHETPVPLDPASFVYSRVTYSKTDPIAWLHLGADRDLSEHSMAQRMERNKTLLELELSEERQAGEVDPRTLLYLMKIYAESTDEATLEECIKMGTEYLELSGWDMERSLCYQLMSRCEGTLERHENARDLLFSAINEYPQNPLLYLHLARVFYNLKNYRAMKHWMDIAMGMDMEDTNNAMNNILEAKVLSAELLLTYYTKAEKDIDKAYSSARILNRVNPTEQNEFNEQYLYDKKALNDASKNAHQLMQYFIDIQQEQVIPSLIKALPEVMQELPFTRRYFNQYSPIKVWADNEICYYASFGSFHFEKWDGNSLKKGIGGSETAVIRLSEQWTKAGHRVTVFCDPQEEVEINGVFYVPFYKFNPRDKFSTFIQWRHSSLADKISAKRFLVDLHDVWHESTHLGRLNQIDKFMVKSKYHRDFAPSINDSKMEVISNGIQ